MGAAGGEYGSGDEMRCAIWLASALYTKNIFFCEDIAIMSFKELMPTLYRTSGPREFPKRAFGFHENFLWPVHTIHMQTYSPVKNPTIFQDRLLFIVGDFGTPGFPKCVFSVS